MHLRFEAQGRNYTDNVSWEKRIYGSAAPGWITGYSEKRISNVAFTYRLLFWKAASVEVDVSSSNRFNAKILNTSNKQLFEGKSEEISGCSTDHRGWKSHKVVLTYTRNVFLPNWNCLHATNRSFAKGVQSDVIQMQCTICKPLEQNAYFPISASALAST